jgi:hypothetical protein
MRVGMGSTAEGHEDDVMLMRQRHDLLYLFVRLRIDHHVGRSGYLRGICVNDWRMYRYRHSSSKVRGDGGVRFLCEGGVDRGGSDRTCASHACRDPWSPASAISAAPNPSCVILCLVPTPSESFVYIGEYLILAEKGANCVKERLMDNGLGQRHIRKPHRRRFGHRYLI